jgi:hypothetical protein
MGLEKQGEPIQYEMTELVEEKKRRNRGGDMLKCRSLHNYERGVEVLVTRRMSVILGVDKEITTCAKSNRL